MLPLSGRRACGRITASRLPDQVCLRGAWCLVPLRCSRGKLVLLLMENSAAAVERSIMSNLDRITSDPLRMNGQPCVRTLRLTVRRVLEALATYPDRSELFREFPELEEEDIRQVLAFASTALDDKVISVPKSA
jgi:uncharacterized protein (DUF433 family)